MKMFRDVEAYYSDNPHRRYSGEADYGVHWRLDGWESRWRVSYVHATGEVYAVHQGRSIGPVFILGVVPPDIPYPQDEHREPFKKPELYYDTLERVLDGWAEACPKPNSLTWVKTRLEDREGVR